MPAPDSVSDSGPPAAGAPTAAPAARRDPYAYAVIRVVPRVERGECLNAGIVLFCRPRRFLEARIHLDRDRLAVLAQGIDPEPIARLLDRVPLVCAGGQVAGPIGLLPPTARFHGLVAPSSTVVHPGPVHAGLTADPAAVLARLFAELVLPPTDPTPRASSVR